MKKSINKIQLSIGVIAMLIGSLVYLVDRSPEETYFVDKFLYKNGISFDAIPNLFGSLGSNLPTFIHVLSLILITAGLLNCQKNGCIIVSISWFFLDCTFELGQKYNSLPLKIIPNWLVGIPCLENSRNYFLLGSFDIFDIVSIAIGAILACFILFFTIEGDK